MNSSRRSFLRGLASAAGVATAATGHAQHVHPPGTPTPTVALPRRVNPEVARSVVPVIMPDATDMPWRIEGSVKVFDIEVGHVRTEFVPGRVVDAWGFNG